MYIAPTTDAVTKIFDFSRYSSRGSLVLIGTLAGETIPLERPLVADPAEDNDAHWTQIKYDGTGQQLDTDNTVLPCPYRLKLRVNKPATTNLVGVRHA